MCLLSDIIVPFHWPLQSSSSYLDMVKVAVFLLSLLVCALPGVSCGNNMDPRPECQVPGGLWIFHAAREPSPPASGKDHPPVVGLPGRLLGAGGCCEDFPVGMG